MGNVWVKDNEHSDRLDPESGANVTSLQGRFAVSAYATAHSDLVALMILAHQAHLHDLISRANWETRIAINQQASENKALAVPRSVDSLPTSANQEDHVSMATNAALRLMPMVGNSNAIVAIELLAAAQGVELRAPLATSSALQAIIVSVRREAAFWERDRAFAPDLERVKARIEEGAFMLPAGSLLLTGDARPVSP